VTKLNLKFSKKIESKFDRNFEGERELRTEFGYRLITIAIKNCFDEDSGDELQSDLLETCWRKDLDVKPFDGSNDYYKDDNLYEFCIQIDDLEINQFNELWKNWKKDWTLVKEEIKEEVKPIDEKEEKYNLTEDIVKQAKFGIKVENEIKKLANKLNVEDRRQTINKFQREEREVNINLYYYTVFACIHDYHEIRKLREIDLKIKKYLDFLIEFRDQVVDQLENKKVKFQYTYKTRGYSPGCQPLQGLIEVKNNIKYKFEILTYDRKLTDKELYEYELKSLN
jgi:hypothetical protein